jgi:glycine C-acetyltransferase
MRKADGEAAQQYGLAYPMGARMMSGNSNITNNWKGTGRVCRKRRRLLLNYGYQGMVSIIDVLCSRHDVIVYDAKAMPALLTACACTPASAMCSSTTTWKILKSKCNVPRIVEKQGAGRYPGDYRRCVWHGRRPGQAERNCLPESKYEFRLLVDDAHGFGTLGATGAGAGEAQGVQDKIDLYFSTFAKIMASIGAFVAGDRKIIDYIRYNIRSQIFAKSLPCPLPSVTLKRLEMLRNLPEMRKSFGTMPEAAGRPERKRL